MVLWTIGVATVSIFVFRFIALLYRYMLKSPLDLQSRYGANSWVLVTGGSDGIGKAFAEQFAELGFNVMIAARSQVKLEKTAEELRKKYAKVSVETVSMDFYECGKAGFETSVEAMVRGKDVSVLVNNVGISYGGQFTSLPLSKLHSELVLCDEATLILTRLLLPKLLARPLRSGVVFNSGMTAVYASPGLAVHSGTKAFEHFFADALEYEIRGKVDVVSLMPAAVCSSRLTNLKPNWMASSCRDVARGAVRDLGQHFESFGTCKHALQAFFLSLLPRCLRNPILSFMVRYMIRHHGL